MSLEERILKKKEQLNSLVTIENGSSEEIVKISQELDVLIVEKMRRMAA